MTIGITWVGITPQQLASVVDAKTLIGDPLRRALRRSAVSVRNDAKIYVPVDTGHLRGSITWEVDDAVIPRNALVGTNVVYAKRVHEGTPAGTVVPPSALMVWAKRHKTNAYVVSAAIRRRGIPANPFLEHALRDNVGIIRGYIERMGREIEDAWGKR
jgi:phage gpG-like protein